MQQFEDFNENDPKYQCCCGCCHVTVSASFNSFESCHFQTGVKLLLALFILGSICQMAVLWLVPIGYLVIVAWCTIYALNNEKHVYLWVFIIVTVSG
jgi:hypothetical protein